VLELSSGVSESIRPSMFEGCAASGKLLVDLLDRFLMIDEVFI